MRIWVMMGRIMMMKICKRMMKMKMRRRMRRMKIFYY